MSPRSTPSSPGRLNSAINLFWLGKEAGNHMETTRRRLMLSWIVIVAYQVSLAVWLLTTGRFADMSRIPLSTTGLLLYFAVIIGLAAMVALRFFSTRVVGQLLEARAEAMKKARDASVEATQAKSAFLANMSHEIRTPLNAVIGMSNILADSELDDKQRQQLNVIHTSGRHLLTLINDILDFSKIEAGKLELEKSPMSIRRCVEESLDLVARQAFEKNLSLTYDIADNVPEGIIGDIGRLRQVIVNLANNAVKFTEEGGVKVTVRSKKLDDKAVDIKIAVEDTGIGIAPDVQKRLFSAFQQADASTTRQYGGTGLGLAITKMLAEEMGGGVGLKSKVGVGSTFSVHFPTRVAKLRRALPWVDGPIELKGKVALVVDDHSANIDMLVHHLEKWGMKAFSTQDPKEALELVKGKSLDVSILDQIMPKTNGVQLAKQFFDHDPKLPIIIATSGADVKDEGPNVVAIIQKPVKPSDLYDSLVKTLLDAGHGPKMKAASTGFSKELAAENPLRILIAEDAVHNQMVAMASLEKFGYKADLAENGKEALEACMSKQYDLVFMDLQMPVMDGYAATEAICKLPVPPRIVGLSAHVGAEEKERCAEVGMDGYLSKPFAVADLRKVLAETTPIKDKGTSKPTPKATPVTNDAKASNGAKGTKAVDVTTCAAVTAAGKPCSRAPRAGSKYCASHKGYRPPRRVKKEA